MSHSNQPDHAALSWQRLAMAIHAHYPLAKHRGNALRFVLSTGDDNTRIGIQVAPFDSYGQSKLVILADLGLATQVEPWDALQLNASLSFGALAVIDKGLVLRATVQLIDTNEDTALILIQHIAAEALQIKQRLQITCGDGSAFAHYGE